MGGLCFSPSSTVIDDNKRTEEKKEVSRVFNKDMAMLDLKRRRRDCEEYVKKMDLKIQEAKNAALVASKDKNKSKAIFAMKLKKMHEATKDKALGMLETLEKTAMNLEQASMDSDVFQALQKGDQVIKELRSQASLEGFQEIYDHLQEHSEIAEFMTKEVVNEGEYAEELDKLQDQLDHVDEVKAKLDSPELQPPTVELKHEEKVKEVVKEEKKELVLA